MALSITQTLALQSILKPGMAVASFGYPDIIAPLSTINTWLGKMSGFLEFRPDSPEICARHGLRQHDIPDAHSLFSLLGCDLDVYDIVKERGCEILCDLNNSNAVFTGEYDIVLDVGTVEHCFNISQAMINMAGMAKEGGYIVHENPFNCGNHGFYNLNPTFYVDFYETNGFEIIECKLVNRNGDHAVVPLTQRFKACGEEVNTFALARRIKIGGFVNPVQSKYRKLLAAAWLAGEKVKELA